MEILTGRKWLWLDSLSSHCTLPESTAWARFASPPSEFLLLNMFEAPQQEHTAAQQPSARSLKAGDRCGDVMELITQSNKKHGNVTTIYT